MFYFSPESHLLRLVEMFSYSMHNAQCWGSYKQQGLPKVLFYVGQHCCRFKWYKN